VEPANRDDGSRGAARRQRRMVRVALAQPYQETRDIVLGDRGRIVDPFVAEVPGVPPQVPPV